MNWTAALRILRAAGESSSAALVTVTGAEGSTPREAGTRMIVTPERVFGTIGGGNLEFKSIELARAQLAASGASAPVSYRFPLGPGLGQCCGGVASVVIERIDAQRFAALEREAPALPRLMLFGAGHVGRALMRVLAGLPLQVVWVDGREGQFPAGAPHELGHESDLGTEGSLELRESSAPEAEVDTAPPGAYYLVMTHSHALDQAIVERILRRGDAAYCGLIGSRTKRALFERRLAERGLPREAFAGLTCPIGLPSIRGKVPGVIAVAVAAQLLELLERRAVAADPARIKAQR